MPHLITLRDEVSLGLWLPGSQSVCPVQWEDIDPAICRLWIISYFIQCYDTAKCSHVETNNELINCKSDVFITWPIDIGRTHSGIQLWPHDYATMIHPFPLAVYFPSEEILGPPHINRQRNSPWWPFFKSLVNLTCILKHPKYTQAEYSDFTQKG